MTISKRTSTIKNKEAFVISATAVISKLTYCSMSDIEVYKLRYRKFHSSNKELAATLFGIVCSNLCGDDFDFVLTNSENNTLTFWIKDDSEREQERICVINKRDHHIKMVK